LFSSLCLSQEALVGGELRVRHLDERLLRVPFRGPLRPGHQQIVAGEGMPISKTPGKRGDLIVVFDVAWPDEITEEAREKLLPIPF
jgi:DnaJ-class molecular chaperone